MRSLAALAFTAGAVVLIVFLTLLGKAPGIPPEVRHLREMKERRDVPARIEPATFAEFAALPHGASLAEFSGIERRGVSLEGYVQRVLRAADGDVHLEIAMTPRAPGGPDTTYVTAEVTPEWRGAHAAWSYERLLVALRPNRGGPTVWESGPSRVRISGWLLYDFQYDTKPSTWSLQHGAPRITGWEIHPVTEIETWDEAGGRWARVRE